jgi:hypothetical protein
MCVEALGAQSSVERLDERVVGRLARSAEVERDVVGVRPEIEVTRDKLRAIVGSNGLGISDLAVS